MILSFKDRRTELFAKGGFDRAGQYSIRINQPWRICFEWSESEKGPSNVEIFDYH
jgi:plasmid maintenance system killer protein